MAKRFTDTEIWQKDWFLDLPIKQKLLVKFIFDNCDCAGIYEISYRVLKNCFGEEIKKEDPNPKPTGFARFSKLKGSEKYLSVLRKTDLYHFLADSEEQADLIGIRNLSGKDLLEKHLC